MMYWIKRIARLLALLTFFTVFVSGIDPADPFNVQIAVWACAKGCAGALLFWLLGFIIADIVIKGLVTDIRTDENDTMEGGILQRLHDVQSNMARPGAGGAGVGKPPEKSGLVKAPKASS